jgi:hypothetical protein
VIDTNASKQLFPARPPPSASVSAAIDAVASAAPLTEPIVTVPSSSTQTETPFATSNDHDTSRGNESIPTQAPVTYPSTTALDPGTTKPLAASGPSQASPVLEAERNVDSDTEITRTPTAEQIPELKTLRFQPALEAASFDNRTAKPTTASDTTYGYEIKVEGAITPVIPVSNYNTPSADLASAGREVLQQAAAASNLEDNAIEVPPSYITIIDECRFLSSDADDAVRNQSHNSDTKTTELSTKAAPLNAAKPDEMQQQTASPSVCISVFGHSRISSSVPIAPQTILEPGATSPATEKLKRSPATPTELEKDLFGFEDGEELPVYEDPDAELEIETAVVPPTTAPPPPPAMPPIRSQSSPVTETFIDLMSLLPIDREDEAKLQIARKAGMSVRDYPQKFGKERIHQQARDMIRERRLEEERESEDFLDEQRRRKASLAPPPDLSMTPEQIKEHNLITKRAMLEKAWRERTSPRTSEEEVAVADAHLRKPVKKNKWSVTKLASPTRTSLTSPNGGVENGKVEEMNTEDIPNVSLNEQFVDGINSVTETVKYAGL